MTDADFAFALDRLLAGIDQALERQLAGMLSIVEAVDDLKLAVLTVEQNDHRRARQLLREGIEILTNEDSALDHRDWVKEARRLVPPLDEPFPTAEELRGIRSPEAPPLPVIQRDDE